MRNALIGAGIVVVIGIAVVVGMKFGEKQKGPGEEMGQALDDAASKIKEGLQKASE